MERGSAFQNHLLNQEAELAPLLHGSYALSLPVPMREALGVTSGLLALLFAAGVFSLLLLDAPSGLDPAPESTAEASADRRATSALSVQGQAATIPVSVRQIGAVPLAP